MNEGPRETAAGLKYEGEESGERDDTPREKKANPQVAEQPINDDRPREDWSARPQNTRESTGIGKDTTTHASN